MKRLFERYPVRAVMVLALLCLSPVMALRDVTPSNELRYLSIADEALQDGHLFAFANHGEPYADKPPLYFWIIMLCRLVFGRHSIFILSLFSFIPAVVTAFVMDRWAFGNVSDTTPKRRSTMALMLMTTFYWLGLTVFLRMDMLMTMFIVLALWSWHRDRPWLFALYTFLALFTKGPVGILMPPVVILTYILSCRRRAKDHPRMHAFRFLGWRFLLLVGGCCAVWFTFAWLEGGNEYLHNLLFHQTVERTVNAFHHKRPFWYYLTVLLPVLLPWCLLTVPAAIASLVKRDGTAAPATDAESTEKLFRCAFFATLVMLSCSSGKLPIYLLPIFPFVTYLLPFYVKRTGWKRWMDWAVAVPAILMAMTGIALVAGFITFDRFPSLEPYGFARSPLLVIAGALLICGGIMTAAQALRRERELDSIRPLSFSILLFLLAISPLTPGANDYIGYRALCREVPEGEKVYVWQVRRPENMDVYLGRQVTVAGKGEPLPEDGVLIAPSSFNVPALEGRERRVHGPYAVWLPAEGK